MINCGNVHGSHLGLIPGQRADETFIATPWFKVGLGTRIDNENDHSASFSICFKLKHKVRQCLVVLITVQQAFYLEICLVRHIWLQKAKMAESHTTAVRDHWVPRFL